MGSIVSFSFLTGFVTYEYHLRTRIDVRTYKRQERQEVCCMKMSSTPGSTNNNSNNAPGGGGGSNWFEQFQQRCPFVTRTLLISFLSCTLLGWITGIYTVFFNCPLQTVMGLQVWRLFTSFLMEGSVLGLLFSVLMFYPLAKQMEASMSKHIVLV